jgi:hypothetical protein
MIGGGSPSQLKAKNHQRPNDMNPIAKNAGTLTRLTQNNLADVHRGLIITFGVSIMSDSAKL